MFEVIPYWMWAASLLALAVVCGAALGQRESRWPTVPPARHGATPRARWLTR